MILIIIINLDDYYNIKLYYLNILRTGGALYGKYRHYRWRFIFISSFCYRVGYTTLDKLVMPRDWFKLN